MDSRDHFYALSKGVESLTKEEHGLFFDAVQRLELSNEVKLAAISLYLDFKRRPAGAYAESRNNLKIFLVASISLAAKVLGDWRTDQEFESKMFVSKEKLADAEERVMLSFRVQDSARPYPELISQLTKRQILIMAEGFAKRGLIDGDKSDELIERSNEYLGVVVGKGLNPKMSYRGRAAGVVLNAVRDLGLRVSELDVATAAGFSKGLMLTNAELIGALLKESKSSETRRR